MSAIKLAAAIVVYKDDILVVRRSKIEHFLPENWGVPCGKVDVARREKSRQAVLRELHEETGLEAKIVCFAGKSEFVSMWRGSRKRNVQLNYLVKPVSDDSKRPEVRLPETDQEYHWVPRTSLLGLRPENSASVLDFRLDAHNLDAIQQALRAWRLPLLLRAVRLSSLALYRHIKHIATRISNSPVVVGSSQDMPSHDPIAPIQIR
jgi:ADP-ribose pyrophosphatase YjhB (NUDIX family)